MRGHPLRPEQDPARSPPPAALVLGAAGLLPPLLAIGVQISIHGSLQREPSSFIVAMPALGYAALILSFLGGMWWGAAASRVPAERLAPWLLAAVVPSLVAFGAFMLGGKVAPAPWGTAIVLAAGLMLALPVDLRLAREGLVPAWWMRLRVPLSCLLAAEAIAVAALTG